MAPPLPRAPRYCEKRTQRSTFTRDDVLTVSLPVAMFLRCPFPSLDSRQLDHPEHAAAPASVPRPERPIVHRLASEPTDLGDSLLEIIHALRPVVPARRHHRDAAHGHDRAQRSDERVDHLALLRVYQVRAEYQVRRPERPGQGCDVSVHAPAQGHRSHGDGVWDRTDRRLVPRRVGADERHEAGEVGHADDRGEARGRDE